MRMQTLRICAALAASVLVSAGLGACGGSGSGYSGTGSTGNTPPQSGSSGSSVNGCTSYTDATADSASRTVTFTYPSYSPKCLMIAAGQSVTFSGSFSSHPLTPGVAPDSSGTASPNNPIPATSSGSSLTVSFPNPGTYPYYCALHFAAGMTGVIQVM